MALFRLIRSEAFKLTVLGFALGTAGVVASQPGQAQDSAVAATPAR